eukprot:TRINITY_DN49193_c0_g1_i1.p1 TRINITY_DN49193_c0_g1~~TRINITY_DN49193_c0_g1_i1.p1  ORF type:complete len:306 (-),score=69.49 TRINITY_DN49193_c0_g1_i1:296-1213(-)
MDAIQINEFAAFLGEAPTEAALRRSGKGFFPSPAATPAGARNSRSTSRGPGGSRRKRDDDSSADSNGFPEDDGGFDDNDCDNDAPFSKHVPKSMPHLEEPQEFDCRQNIAPLALVAAKRSADMAPQLARSRQEAQERADSADMSYGSQAAPKQRASAAVALAAAKTLTPEPGSFAAFMASPETPPVSGRRLRTGITGTRSAAEIDLSNNGNATPAAKRTPAARDAKDRQQKSLSRTRSDFGQQRERESKSSSGGAGVVTKTLQPAGSPVAATPLGASARTTSLGQSVRHLDVMGTTSRRRFGGRA